MGERRIPQRVLGKTGLKVSVLGLGGFHQVEIGQSYVERLVERYLEAGGNYIETARSYGGGAAERKLGRALVGKRAEIVLVSKTGQREAEGAWQEINESLEALKTDYLDILLYHGVNDREAVKAILAPGGAAQAFARAREEGMVHFIGVSSHWPQLLPWVMEQLDLDVVMYWVNYLDFCHYPEIPQQVAPAARSKRLGIIGMKPLADGYLYRSVREAFTFALAQEVDVLACGFNSLEMLERDIEAVCAWTQPNVQVLETILRDAPELGDYVCRQCGQCRLPDLDLPKVFELEGKFDRQMFDGRPKEAPDYALRQRLGPWFHNQERAITLYKPYAERVRTFLEESRPLPACPYGIDLSWKLRLAHLKLTSDGRFPAGAADDF
ncbi:MAG: aldo/keto reductase [Anaerolineae bacterium]|nr:aldo/keto reductase [Anaerolineae bacterium]